MVFMNVSKCMEYLILVICMEYPFLGHRYGDNEITPQ